ncbi:hypothetical protein [Nocardia sp. NPDC057353]|uniref:hypothetical protein n=1 Tax=Nocardia sp. NPDC057353 TaxID=3346104 RepID=UPI00363AAFA1
MINLALSGEASAHRAIIDDLARASALRLALIVTIDHDTYMPITYIITTAARTRADTVIAPDLEHFGTGYTAMTLACALLVPTELIPHRTRERNRTPSIGNRQ